jgi:hypothetical protein
MKAMQGIALEPDDLKTPIVGPWAEEKYSLVECYARKGPLGSDLGQTGSDLNFELNVGQTGSDLNFELNEHV